MHRLKSLRRADDLGIYLTGIGLGMMLATSIIAMDMGLDQPSMGRAILVGLRPEPEPEPEQSAG